MQAPLPSQVSFSVQTESSASQGAVVGVCWQPFCLSQLSRVHPLPSSQVRGVVLLTQPPAAQTGVPLQALPSSKAAQSALVLQPPQS